MSPEEFQAGASGQSITVLGPFSPDISGLTAIHFPNLGQEKAFDKMYHDSLMDNFCTMGIFSLIL